MAFKKTYSDNKTPRPSSRQKPGASKSRRDMKPERDKPERGKPAAFQKYGRPDKLKRLKQDDTRGFAKATEAEADENYCLIGRNAVLEAINHGKPVDKVLLRKDGVEGSLKMIAAKARERKIVVQEVDRARLEMLAGGSNHQGVVALCPPQEYAEVEDMLALAKERGEAPFLIVLDGVTDPHNLGAIIRTADASGAHGVIIPKRRAAGITPVVTKASAGAVSHVLVARVPNLVATVDDLKKRGVWIAAADFGDKTMYSHDLTGALAIVIGSEGEGVSKLVKQHCDFGIGIPMQGKLDSLNASVAAGILMYEAVRQRVSDKRPHNGA